MTRHAFAGLALAAVMAGCGGSSEPLVCTQIGCDSGIEVMLEPPPAAPYSVEAYASPQQQRHTYRCEPGTCPPRIMFPGFTPERATIEVIAQGDTVRHDVTPSYIETQPNGPGCDPVCRNAVVRLPADAATR